MHMHIYMAYATVVCISGTKLNGQRSKNNKNKNTTTTKKKTNWNSLLLFKRYLQSVSAIFVTLESIFKLIKPNVALFQLMITLFVERHAFYFTCVKVKMQTYTDGLLKSVFKNFIIADIEFSFVSLNRAAHCKMELNHFDKMNIKCVLANYSHEVCIQIQSIAVIGCGWR